uniref:Vesicle transport protein n=1 Tax=Aureoumbra lagunensis TaxID=44058 RepID=A0A7S3JN59_9STRA|mmetsp:Transcript_9657/g.13390  ORF Transcript_9657/g.13390 Transcript_9657/m.13390 type:complete len:146 (+) Transcript_9657:98-535(+)
MFSDNQKIGTSLLGLGFLFLALGVMFLFDKFLLSLGNIMFLAGLLITMGFSRSIRFFRKKIRDCGIRGVGCFFLGVSLVLIFRRPMLGMILESFGFLNLFANFFPIALQAMRQMPVIGPILDTPGISSIADKIAGVDQRRARSWA